MPRRHGPSLQTIAQRAGVSPMTVSRALRNAPEISPATASRIKRWADKLGYRPDPAVSELMVRLRGGGPREVAPIAFLTAFPTRAGWKQSASVLACEEGARARAAELGYKLEHFWLGEPGMTEARLSDILFHRGIRGVLVAPMPVAQARLALTWSRFAAATFGWSLVKPDLHRACSNQSQAATVALQALHARGYRRIGLAISSMDDARTDHAWLASLLLHFHHHPAAAAVPPLIEPQLDRSTLSAWIKQHQPDAVLGVADTLSVFESLTFGRSGRPAFAVLNLDGVAAADALAGVVHHTDRLGAAALDLIIEQLHAHQLGLPVRPKIVMTACRWQDGASAPARAVR